jgi:hypothetical protein
MPLKRNLWNSARGLLLRKKTLEQYIPIYFTMSFTIRAVQERLEVVAPRRRYRKWETWLMRTTLAEGAITETLEATNIGISPGAAMGEPWGPTEGT